LRRTAHHVTSPAPAHIKAPTGMVHGTPTACERNPDSIPPNGHHAAEHQRPDAHHPPAHHVAPISEQLVIPGSHTNPALTAARFLLKPGRKYEEAVKTFQPYERVKEKNNDARAAGAKLIAEGNASAGKKKTFIYVNNRLEGNALETIAAMLETAVA
jgi:hypothetical protein